MPPFDPYRPGQRRLSAAQENARSELLRALADGYVDGADQDRGPGGVPQTQLPFREEGFFALLGEEGTGGDAGLYAWQEEKLQPDGTLAVLDGGRTGAVTPDVRDPIRELNEATGLASGLHVWVLPPSAPAVSAAAGEVDSHRRFVVAGGGGSTGFYARLTTEGTGGSAGRWKWWAQTLNSSGVWVDSGSESTTFNAVPSTVDGTNLANPAAGLRVWMVPSSQAGFYEFEPYGYASATKPGLVSAAAQTFAGAKTFAGAAAFESTVHVTGDATLDADLTVAGNAYLAQGTGPDVHVGQTDGSYTGRVTTHGPGTFVESQGEFGTVTVQPDGSDGLGTGSTHNEPGIVLVNGSAETGAVSLVSGATVSADVPAGTVRIVEGVLTGAVRASEFYLFTGGGPGLIYNPFNTGPLEHIANPTAGSDYYLGSDGGDPLWVARPATRLTGSIIFTDADGNTVSIDFDDGECTGYSSTPP